MTTLRRSLAAGAALCLVACATTSDTAQRRGGSDRTRLTAETLASHAGRNLYDVIRQERPHWLTTRGPGTFSGPEDIVVYLDGNRVGGASVLHTVNTDVVSMVQYLSGPEAGARFGLNHQNGAVLITTKPDPLDPS